MNMMTDILELFSQFAMVGGGLWLVWGAIVTGGALRDQNGPQIQTGVWQIVGGGLILGAAVLFNQIAIP